MTIIWAVSWKPESVGRAFQALVDSGLPREACKDLGEFLVLTKKHLRKQLARGQADVFTLGIDDLFFHQEEPIPGEGRPVVLRIPEWLHITIGDLCDTEGMPIAYPLYYAMGECFTRSSRDVGGSWQQVWAALKRGLVGSAILPSIPESTFHCLIASRGWAHA